ncbi:MAG: hypothetical protein ABI321_13615 [Polyangia bacterium]
MSVVLVLCVSAPVFAGSYEMKDLEALEKQESWQEALDHLGDIAPSKRDKTWDRIAEKSAIAIMGTMDSSKDVSGRGYNSRLAPPRALAFADDLAAKYPMFKKSKTFMAARADAALKGFKFTFNNSSHSTGNDPWLEQVKAFQQTDTTTPDIPLRIGKMISGRLVAYMAIPFYKPALASNGGLCKDADVKAAIVSSVVSNVWMDDGKAMAEKCWGDVKGGIEVEVKKEDADEARKYACPVLAAHKITPAECKLP